MKNFMFTLAMALAGVGVFLVQAQAAPFSNGSFETNVLGSAVPFQTLGVNNNGISPWKIEAGNIDHIRTYWTASDGYQSIDLTGWKAGKISQTFDTVPGYKYVFAFDMSGNPAGDPQQKEIVVEATGAMPKNYKYDTVAMGASLLDMKWKEYTYYFVATAPVTTLTFKSLVDTWYGPALDNVRLASVMPTEKDQCKQGGWMDFHHPDFKNQGQCVSYMMSNEHSAHHSHEEPMSNGSY